MASPPPNPFETTDENSGSFDAFNLSSTPNDDSNASTMTMPSLQSLQNHQNQLELQRQQQLHQQQYSMGQGQNNETQWEKSSSSLPSPQELQGQITQDSTWPPPPASSSTSGSYGNNNANNMNNNRNMGPNYGSANNNASNSFLHRLFSCFSVEALRPYFDVDTVDILVRIQGSIKYCLVNDGFRNEVLYSDNALRLSLGNSTSATTTTADVGGTEESKSGGENVGQEQQSTNSNSDINNNNAATTNNTMSSGGKGPDLYGPIWITMTLVFFVAVTSNMSIYVHHSFGKSSSAFSSSTSASSSLSDVISETPIQAEQEWDYDINHLLRATSILYSFTLLLPFILYFVFRIVGVTSVSMVELMCIYGYSLVPYLPMTWMCILPYGWVQWGSLGVGLL